MSQNGWMSAYYVSKFLSNLGKNSKSTMEGSILIRQLALDRALRRKVLREKRRALRQQLHCCSSAKSSTRRLSFVIFDYGEEDWSTDEEVEEAGKTPEVQPAQESAAMRESRLRVMKNLPKCADNDMAQRYKTMKQVKNDNQTSDVRTMAEWNTLRKRLISAKMMECKNTKKVNVADTVYTLVKKIGDGGFSSVYQVYDDERKTYALKLVNLLNMDGYTDKDLMNEIELLKVSIMLHNSS